ncbi:MAG: hypothetical protein WED05_06050 [Candidatus Atabeyarchaeum deiterrae]
MPRAKDIVASDHKAMSQIDFTNNLKNTRILMLIIQRADFLLSALPMVQCVRDERSPSSRQSIMLGM